MKTSRSCALLAQSAIVLLSCGAVVAGIWSSGTVRGQGVDEPESAATAGSGEAPAESNEQPQSTDDGQPTQSSPSSDPSAEATPTSRVRVHVDPKSGDFVIEKLAAPGDDEKDEKDRALSFFDHLDLPSIWVSNSWRQWLFLLAAIFAGVAAGRIALAALRRIGERWKDSRWEIGAKAFSDGARPANLALMTVGAAVGLAQIELSDPIREFVRAAIGMLLLIALFWYVYNLISVIDIFLRRLTARTESKLDDQLVPLIRKTLRIFLVIVAALIILEVVFGADVGAALAGLGIAGLAVSLAAQDSLKNLFGSITILFDRPFQLGERIVFQGVDGTVEEIGFRSTKVRTLVGHVVTIPNSAIVNEKVENIGRRPHIRRTMNVTITYDTPAEKIEQAVQIIRDLLESDEFREPIHVTIGDKENPPRVFFNDLNADSLNILVLYWYAPPNWWDYMEHAQRFNLELFRRFEAAGIEFAVPTPTLYLAGDQKRELAIRMLGADLSSPGKESA